MEHHPQPWEFAVNSAIVMVILVLLAYFATRKLSKVPQPVGLQNIAEQVVETFEYLAVNSIGPHGKKYTALIGTIFTFILVSNLWGQISFISQITVPELKGFHVVPPTASLNTNLSIALIVFFYVQFEGIRSNGLIGYVKHFMGPMIALAPLMLFIELIGELAKPVSLSLRLYGNIFGEEQIIGVLSGFGKALFGIPIHFPMLVFGVFTSVVQALVFTMLTCIYLSLMTSHEAEEHSHEPAVAAAH